MLVCLRTLCLLVLLYWRSNDNNKKLENTKDEQIERERLADGDVEVEVEVFHAVFL